jgi:transposase
MTMLSMPPLVSGNQNDSANEVILGVDTHSDVHVAAVITALGVLLDTAQFPATAAGYRALLAWVGTFGVLRRAGVEGTGSYGAALSRHLRAAGVEVIEVNAPDKATRRHRGKTDTLDAEAAARAVLSGRASGSAKAGDGPVEMLRMLKLAKDSAIKARTQTINQPESRARGGRPGPA